jgi:hypothetical protein
MGLRVNANMSWQMMYQMYTCHVEKPAGYKAVITVLAKELRTRNAHE